VRAADHYNLDEGLPLHLEDAFPLASGNREIQISGGYERTKGNADRFTLVPRLEFGIAKNWQVSVDAPFYKGNDDTTNSGNLRLGALYNFNQESTWFPALSLAGRAELPTGENSQGIDAAIKFIATKTIGNENLDRLHLNLEFAHKFDEVYGERSDRHKAILGYSRRLGPDALLVADLVRERELEDGMESNMLEVGIRWALDPRTVLSIGGGPGFGDDSPRWGATIGLQYSF
jgi:hypothetical protein